MTFSYILNSRPGIPENDILKAGSTQIGETWAGILKKSFIR
jgi:hypothetical protein